MFYPSSSNDFLGSSILACAIFFAIAKIYEDNKLRGVHSGQFAVQRSLHDIYDCLDARYFCLTYCMTFDSFWSLHASLFPHIVKATQEMRSYRKVGGRACGNYVLPLIPNGEIRTGVCLACAVRFLLAVVLLTLHLYMALQSRKFFSVFG
jgi:hypothetical protein